MPGGRKPKTTPGPSALRGFDAPNHGDRSRLEQTMAAGGASGAGVGGAAPSPTSPPPPPSLPTRTAPPLPFSNPMYDESGNIRDGGMNAPVTEPPFPDDPDLFLKAMYRATHHPDVLALLEPRTRPHLYEGVDVGAANMGMGGEMGMGVDDPFMELPTDPLVSGPNITSPSPSLPPTTDPTIPPNPTPPPPDPSTPLPPAADPGAV